MISALAKCYGECGGRICNQGKTQHLAIAVLQGNGRLEGVSIDNEAEKPSNEEALEMFFMVENGKNKEIDSLTDLLATGEQFCKANPAVDKEVFMKYLREGYAPAQGMEE